MQGEYTISGIMIYGEEFEVREGYVVVEGSRIKEVGFERCDSPIEGLICPAFVNAHTHVGDSIAKDLPFLPLLELVAPPDGLKHRILNAASRSAIADGMRSALDAMRRTGACHFIDFREGGVQGSSLLKGLAGGKATVLGRLAPEDSVEELLSVADGVGISSARDLPAEALHAIVEKAKKSRKIIGIHAGELNRNDIDNAIEIMPDFLVHMTQATASDMRRVADHGIPVVVCPRSNAVTGVGLPPVKQMREAGITLALGTDNVMMNSPDMFREMEWADKLFLHDDAYALRMATLNAARLARLNKGALKPGMDADLLVFNLDSDTFKSSQNLLSTIVRRAGPDDISYFIEEGKAWRNCSRKY
ncbi:Cytosine deaminase and related metal-dependent hydrolase [Methanocella conradii HZ254]|uniref:Cytosine deaminase and related metal-dependent hydrolase n=1 Tax=Methanocella conradii (strain DSM 24694 / JCM 17849 / CGMCC 1.5162 / HZ254) TaxID=1041930 RepID=H8I946_METCZ|nr:amidohydrolase family protein [Methanocella conradii]AFC99049.1 Cytosine deaminase and related metal-dependent hydrolase [Methanocella conradii HZ254]